MRNDIDDLIGFQYNNDVYYYIKNSQDDIIGILDSNYSIVAKYTYDSWGNILSIVDNVGNDISTDMTHIANINPFRYRSYYYDKETNLYYLNSRYYNPMWGRFINADSILCSNQDILSYNLYSYCSNNPVNLSDPSGQGLFKSLAKVAKKVLSTGVKIITSFVNKVVATTKKMIEKIVSIEQTTSVDKVPPRQTGIDGIITYETGSSTSTTKTIFGNEDSLLKIGINNSNILDSSITFSTNSNLIDLSHEFGLGSSELSITATIDNKKYSYNVGLEHFDLYMGFSADNDLGNNVTDNYYGKINVNILLPIIIYGMATGTCPSPSQCVPSFAY